MRSFTSSTTPGRTRSIHVHLLRLFRDGAGVLDGLAPLGDVALQPLGEPALRRGHHDQADPGQAFLTTCWPSRSVSACARMRPNVSELPPGACGTISRIGRDGKDDVWAAPGRTREAAIAAMKPSARRRGVRIIMSP